MTRMLVDLGNSRIKWAWAETPLRSRHAEYHADLRALLDAQWGSYDAPAQVWVASVADAARRAALQSWVAQQWSCPVHSLTAAGQQCGVRNRYQDPAQLGADRWAALIAARRQQAGNVCVVDCGTAVTIDALDADGVFRGGVILPGIATARRALLQSTAQIRDSSGVDDDCCGLTTADAVAAGTLFGTAGAIERIVREQAVGFHAPPQVLLTGGEAALVMPLLHLPYPVHVLPDLVLMGLAIVAQSE